MAHWILICRHCGERKPPLNEREDWFLYCSEKCKIDREEQQLQRRLEQMKTHNPEDRREKSEGELRAMGIIVRPQATSGEASAEPKRRAVERKPRKKGKRKCGKCGQTGHNARTCGRKRTHLRTPEEKRREASDREQVTNAINKLVKAPKPTGSRKKRAASKRRQYKCGKCGGMGHNARTCNG